MFLGKWTMICPWEVTRRIWGSNFWDLISSAIGDPQTWGRKSVTLQLFPGCLGGLSFLEPLGMWVACGWVSMLFTAPSFLSLPWCLHQPDAVSQFSNTSLMLSHSSPRMTHLFSNNANDYSDCSLHLLQSYNILPKLLSLPTHTYNHSTPDFKVCSVIYRARINQILSKY